MGDILTPDGPPLGEPDVTSLFEPLALGRRTAANRVIFGAHFTRYVDPSPVVGEPGTYGERIARYLELRAAGGVGTIIAGQAAVHPSTAYQMTHNAGVWDRSCIPGLAVIADAIHRHDALAMIQLSHNGGVVPGDWSRGVAFAPSPIAQYNEPPVAIDRPMIDELIAAFAQAARNCAEAGIDGVEIHAAHGYLIHQFLTPKLNERTDDYGGSLENRMRFGAGVLEAVRSAVPEDFVVGLRLVGDEEQWDGSGLDSDRCAEIAARFAETGLVDLINVSVGTSGIGMVRPMYARKGLGVAATAKIRAAVQDVAPAVAVAAVHRLTTPAEAAAVLDGGSADAICLVRALIADTEWVNKARAGRPAEIRRCVGCNQGCYGNLVGGLPVTCVTDPAVGREAELAGAASARPPASRRVVVVGGGPAGLEAAWVAAARGHRVTLVERSDELGGKILLAASLPGREEMIGLVDWRIGECGRRGVEVLLGERADVELIRSLAPDAVIVATGARASVTATSKWHPHIDGLDRPEVLDHEAALGMVLGDPTSLGAHVLILDVVGHIEGVGLAEICARAGSRVTLCAPMASPMLLDPETMPVALGRACRAGATWRPFTIVPHIGDDGVMVLDALARRPEVLTDVDTVVIRTHGVADRTLADELLAPGGGDRPEVIVIGDALAARLVDRAINDGHRAGLAL